LNATETKAKAWIEKQGQTIYFAHRESPDFICESGLGYEVKLIRSNCISFSGRQWQQLKEFSGELMVLAYNGGEVPLYIIPFTEIMEAPKYWKRLRIQIFSPNLEFAHIRSVNHELLLMAKDDAFKKKQTQGEWFNDAIRLKLKIK
jgi:hypothetical protein